MSGVAREEKPAVLHRLHYEAAHSSNALLQHGTFGQCPFAIGCREARVQFVPDAVVRPFVDIFIGLALNVEPADLRRTHAEQSKTALVIGVDQLLRRRWRLRENAQPAKRVDAFEHCERACWNQGPANAMKAVAPSDEIAVDFLLSALCVEANLRPRL